TWSDTVVHACCSSRGCKGSFRELTTKSSTTSARPIGSTSSTSPRPTQFSCVLRGNSSQPHTSAGEGPWTDGKAPDFILLSKLWSNIRSVNVKPALGRWRMMLLEVRLGDRG